MHPEPMNILYRSELVHPPQEYTNKSLQKFYYELTQVEGLNFNKFEIVANGADISIKEERTVFSCMIRNDRIILTEEWAKCTLAEFQNRLNELVQLTLRSLNVKFFIAQTCVVRCLFMLTKLDDSRRFLGDEICQLKDKIFPQFKRPAHLFGLSLWFPRGKEDPLAFNLRIESFNEDTTKIFLENIGTYIGQPIIPDRLNLIVENLQRTNDFLVKNTFQFLEQFEKKGA